MSSPAPMSDIGLMTTKSSVMLQGYTTFHGHRVDEMVSGLQKTGIRRGMRKQALYYFRELSIFFLMNEPRSKSVLTNLRNRLVVCLVEDVQAFSEPSLVAYVWYHIHAWDQLAESERTLGSLHHLMHAFIAMCDAKDKSRLPSDIRAMFRDGYLPEFVPRKFDTTLLHKLWQTGKDDTRLQPYFNSFINEMRAGVAHDKEAIWRGYFDLFNKTREKLVLRVSPTQEGKKAKVKTQRKYTSGTHFGKHRTLDYLLWDVLIALANETNKAWVVSSVKAFAHMYEHQSEAKEAHLFGCHAVLTILNHHRISERGWTQLAIETKEQQAEAVVKCEYAMKAQCTLPRRADLEPWVVDMHTAEGRRQGKDRSTFAHEGALIPNECQEFLVPAWRQHYIQQKEAEAKAGKKKRKEAEPEEEEEKMSDIDSPPPSPPSQPAKKVKTEAAAASTPKVIHWQPPPANFFTHVQLVKMPCGRKPATFYAEMRLGRELKDANDTSYSVFVREWSPSKRGQFDSPEVDRIKTRLGLPSAESRVMAGEWLVGTDLGAKGHKVGGLYPTQPHHSHPEIQVVVPLSTGAYQLTYVSDATKQSPVFWREVWRACVWRWVLGCSDTNGSNLLRKQECIVSVDEMGKISGRQDEATMANVGDLFWAQRPSADFLASFQHHQPKSEQLQGWLQEWREKLTPAATSLERHLLARIARLQSKLVA